MIPHVVDVEALPDYRLRLAFRSGERRLFDARPFLTKGLFLELLDESVFARVRLALGTVEWPNGLDFDPELLFERSIPSDSDAEFQADRPVPPSSSAEEPMPTISMFHGIIIRMFFADREHDPPHVHAVYQEHEASFRIDDCSLLTGSLPVGKRRLVEAWIELRRDELLADWTLA